MPLTNRQKYDYVDVDRGELKLIRIGHALWHILRKERRKSQPLIEIDSIEQAIQTVARLKREYRAELKVRRAAKAKKVRDHFDAKKGRTSHRS